ncbi:MAG: squalene--hopene cyclase, partial [Akkermansiaceae bacterium]|nr:squalene--hopene cyclase [Akkermansiaceae bacterium]
IWTRQDPSGAWDDWLKCHWGPFEVDDHFGVTLVTIALNMTPEKYRRKPTSLQANKKLRRFLTAHPPNSLHQKGMLLWASVHDPGLSTPEQRTAWIAELKKRQNKDGGWTLIDLGNGDWIREDNKPHHRSSDGYATAFSLFVLRQGKVPIDDPAIQRGLTWLKANQRQSGRWFTPSPRRDGKHYITQAATNMALLALATCEELPD